jgi:hypothetical protein
MLPSKTNDELVLKPYEDADFYSLELNPGGAGFSSGILMGKWAWIEVELGLDTFF